MKAQKQNAGKRKKLGWFIAGASAHCRRRAAFRACVKNKNPMILRTKNWSKTVSEKIKTRHSAIAGVVFLNCEGARCFSHRL
jgi:hypothetical protein